MGAQVVDLAQNMALLIDGNPKLATIEWFYNIFLKRRPEFKVDTPSKTNIARAQVSPEAVAKYFTGMEVALDAAGVKNKPEHIWNLDETGVSLDHSPPKVLQFAKEKCRMLTAGKTPNTTMISAVNAIGETLAPFFIFKGKRVSAALKEGALPGSQFRGSESGWSNSILFLDFILNHFITNIKTRPIFLLYDGHTTHYPSPVIQEAKKHNIHMFVLPSHSSHFLQPLDVCVFGPFKRKLSQIIHN